MRITQGTFSYLPELTDDDILAQIRYAIARDWAVGVEYTDDPHPRNVYWEMWAPPLFDLAEPASALRLIRDCRSAHPSCYVRLTAYDASLGRQTTAMSFIVHRPSPEPSLTLDRQETPGRALRYTLRPR